ncbi:MAG: CpXC domain-containing protein, partial [Bacteroidales bacterium]|nr:CpXC domain-containing protein [Bacteroidales bacterium]
MFEMKCTRCGKLFEVDAVAAVNTERDPELKEKLMSGELFIRECPQCGARMLA